MVRPLSKEKQQGVLALLPKGCSLRETTKTHHVCKSSVQMLCKKHFPNTKLLVGDKLRKFTSAIERFCVSNLIRGRMSTTREATIHVQIFFGVQVDEAIICEELHRAYLQVHVKEKKLHSLRKNIVYCLAFVNQYEH